MSGAKVVWVSRTGRRMEHNFGWKPTLSYARNWWRESVLECQGILSLDERRNTQLRLIEISNTAEEA